MADVTVHFVHPTDRRVITVTVDDTMTAQEAIGELLANNFVPPSPTRYELRVNNAVLDGNETLAQGGVVNNSKIRVDAALDAGMQTRRY
jgi:hypothetical protein